MSSSYQTVLMLCLALKSDRSSYLPDDSIIVRVASRQPLVVESVVYLRSNYSAVHPLIKAAQHHHSRLDQHGLPNTLPSVGRTSRRIRSVACWWARKIRFRENYFWFLSSRAFIFTKVGDLFNFYALLVLKRIGYGFAHKK